MICMSTGGIIRLFEVWPKANNASFHNLRTEGAFLVSAKLEGGVISPVTIYSEKGRQCQLRNPWQNRPISIDSPGQPTLVLTGDRIHFLTQPGKTYTVSPL